jgi:regulator of sigma E protease
MPGGPAARAGLESGDVVTAVDGAPIQEYRQIQRIVMFSGGDPLEVQVQRRDQRLSFTLTPEWQNPDKLGRYVIGVIAPADSVVHNTRLDPATAVVRGSGEVTTLIRATFTFIGGLIAGREDPQQISGPVGIAEKAGEAIQISILTLVLLMAAISVSIGLINLFPIPMLDGGHLLFYAYEALFGRPMNERAQEYGLRIGLALVVSLMLFATWNDLTRIFWS